MKIGSVFDQTSSNEFMVMLDQQYDNEKLLFSYVELSPNGEQPDPNGERIIARITKLRKENPLLSRDQASISASINTGDLGYSLSRRFTYGWAECTVINTLGASGLDMNRRVIAPNAEVHTPSPETLRQLFFNPAPSYIPLGTIETFGAGAVEEVPVTLNADQLVTKHFCIFGMTGSGKTNTGAKLLEELMARGHRMIIFDSHDDYQNIENFTNLFKDRDANGHRHQLGCCVKNRNCDAVQLAISQLSPSMPTDSNKQPLIPSKSLNDWVCERLIRTASVIYQNEPARRIIAQECRKITPEFVNALSPITPWSNLIRSSQVVSRRTFPEIKFYGDDFQDFSIHLLEAFQGEEFTDAQRRWLRDNIRQAGAGIQYLQNLLDLLEENPPGGKGTKEALEQKLKSIKNIYEDAARSGATSLDLKVFSEYVVDRAKDSRQTVYRLSLSDLSSNLRKALVYGVVTYCFRSFKFGGYRATPREGQPANAYPVLFVLEEARSLIPKSSSDEIDVSAKLARRAMREIAYEGRKFSLGFGLISQKPSTVDSEIVSQANTFILHQLKSPDDQKYVRDVTEGISEDELEMVKSLGQGRAIVTGTAINPSALLRVYFRYSAEGIQEPTPIEHELDNISQIREQLGIRERN